MPNQPQPTFQQQLVEAFVASSIPPTCPPEVVGAAAIAFACEVLDKAEVRAIKGGIAETAWEIQKATESMRKAPVPNPDIAYAMVKQLAPEATGQIEDVMYQARLKWAAEVAEAELAKGEEWVTTPPDLRHAIISQVAGIWADGAVRRVIDRVFYHKMDAVFASYRTQKALLRALLEAPPNLIARYMHRLDPAHQKKLMAQLLPDTVKEVQAQCNTVIHPPTKQ